MLFSTPCNIPKPGFIITHQTGVFLTGSCFTQHIGSRLARCRFDSLYNPYGILYNPVSIENALESIIRRTLPDDTRLVFHNGLWHSYLHHGSFSHESREVFERQMESAMISAYSFLGRATYAFLTPGTAFSYSHAEHGFTVSNCHKMDRSTFVRELLPYDAIRRSLVNSVELLRTVNPDITVIFTVSPVIHIRDGLIGNSRSKSLLVAAVQDICDSLHDTFYFPSFEIVTSELRDYRYYADDMVHPSESAVRYVWERFCETFMDGDTVLLCGSIEHLMKAVEHRPFNPESAKYREHVRRTITAIEELETKCPWISFEMEKAKLYERLSGDNRRTSEMN